MLWKLFGSKHKVEEALKMSVGYDISPNVIDSPASNDDMVYHDKNGRLVKTPLLRSASK